MQQDNPSAVEVPDELLEAIRAFPTSWQVEHCGEPFEADPFDHYADCPRCGLTLKLRSFSALGEIEDVFEWMNRPGAADAARRRQEAVKEDAEPLDSPTKMDSIDPVISRGRGGRAIELGD